MDFTNFIRFKVKIKKKNIFYLINYFTFNWFILKKKSSIFLKYESIYDNSNYYFITN